MRICIHIFLLPAPAHRIKTVNSRRKANGFPARLLKSSFIFNRLPALKGKGACPAPPGRYSLLAAGVELAGALSLLAGELLSLTAEELLSLEEPLLGLLEPFLPA